jgi:hypothetical protein
VLCARRRHRHGVGLVVVCGDLAPVVAQW